MSPETMSDVWERVLPQWSRLELFCSSKKIDSINSTNADPFPLWTPTLKASPRFEASDPGKKQNHPIFERMTLRWFPFGGLNQSTLDALCPKMVKKFWPVKVRVKNQWRTLPGFCEPSQPSFLDGGFPDLKKPWVERTLGRSQSSNSTPQQFSTKKKQLFL